MQAGNRDESSARGIADEYTYALAGLDPALGIRLGFPGTPPALPDLSSGGIAAVADLARRTLRSLDALEQAGTPAEPMDARCAQLLRERLNAELALRDESEEDHRTVGVFNGGWTLTAPTSAPLMGIRDLFTLMPSATTDDWQAVAELMNATPVAIAQYRSTLAAGLGRGIVSGPSQVRAVIATLDQMLAGGPAGWFGTIVAPAPDACRATADKAAAAIHRAYGEMRDWLHQHYVPACVDTPDPVGRDRYRRFARQWNGADLDLDEASSWAWQQFHDIWSRMEAVAATVRPGATPLEAMAWLNEHGEAYDVPDGILGYLQGLIDDVITALQGTHFDLPEPLRKVEAMQAPAGSMAAPYYSQPTLDFSRPGRTWLPTRGLARMPVWNLIALWYHESVPGHHMQVGLWTYLAGEMSVYQGSMGFVAGNAEGWALYAEQLMNELGYLDDPAAQLGFLNAQMQRTQRVIIDIGMHAGLTFPPDSPFRPGALVEPASAREFYGTYCGLPSDQLDSEMIRYLSIPGQAICYKLGERVWMAGRAAAQAAQGSAFDLKTWHMAALSLGSLGLDDLAGELAQL